MRFMRTQPANISFEYIFETFNGHWTQKEQHTFCELYRAGGNNLFKVSIDWEQCENIMFVANGNL